MADGKRNQEGGAAALNELWEGQTLGEVVLLGEARPALLMGMGRVCVLGKLCNLFLIVSPHQ